MPTSVSRVPRPTYLTLEVCVTSVDDADRATAAGADRLELCSALEVGGVSPSPATFLEVRAEVRVPVYVLVRPRPGGFFYSPGEWATIRRDVEWFLRHGADGIVCGVLTEAGALDLVRCGELVSATEGKFVLHRAFDLLSDPVRSLPAAIDLGVERILTSGGAVTAIEGTSVIKQLVRSAGGRIGVMAGGGIRSGNVVELIRATRCDQVHGSFRALFPQQAGKRAVASAMGTAAFTSMAEVAAVRAELDRLAAG